MNVKISNRNLNNRNKKVKTFISNHKHAFWEGIDNLFHASFSNTLTIFILGITLALPVCLYLTALNINTSVNSWQDGIYQYTVYLNNNISEIQTKKVNDTLNSWPEIKNTEIITKEQGINELATALGVTDILKDLDHNPLPTVILVTLNQKHQNITKLKNLISKTDKLSSVKKVEAEIFWLEKVSNLTKLIFFGLDIFIIALSFAVLLVIGNTIRLNLQSKQKDMSIYSLLGATNAYIRRPYLYGGTIYGIFTGMIAVSTITFLLHQINQIINQLGFNQLLNASGAVFNLKTMLLIIVISGFLGWLGARLSLILQIRLINKELVNI